MPPPSKTLHPLGPGRLTTRNQISYQSVTGLEVIYEYTRHSRSTREDIVVLMGRIGIRLRV